jgi:hypothetical protein
MCFDLFKFFIIYAKEHNGNALPNICKLLIHRVNIMKWKEILFSLLVNVSWERFCLSCSVSVVGT